MDDAYKVYVRSCEVCHREREVMVHSSSFAAYSYASCAECLGYYAEPAWVFEYLRDWVDSPEGNQLKEEVYEGAYTYWDDQYMLYKDWLKLNPWSQERMDEAYKELDRANERLENE